MPGLFLGPLTPIIRFLIPLTVLAVILYAINKLVT